MEESIKRLSPFLIKEKVILTSVTDKKKFKKQEKPLIGPTRPSRYPKDCWRIGIAVVRVNRPRRPGNSDSMPTVRNFQLWLQNIFEECKASAPLTGKRS